MLIVAASGIPFKGLAQVQHHNQHLVHGKVIDAEKLIRIPFVHISILGSSKGAITNLNGEFSLSISKNDTLRISCVGFKTAYLAIDNVNLLDDNISIALFPTTVALDPVFIRPWPSDVSALKRAVLETDGSVGDITLNARKNMKVLAYIGTYGGMMKIEMNEYDNYRNTMNGPQGFNIKGAIGLLGSLLSGGKLPGSRKHFEQKMIEKH